MRTGDVLQHFGGFAETAEALGISRQAVYKWGKVVPATSAIRIERLTGGQLKIQAHLYKKHKGGATSGAGNTMG